MINGPVNIVRLHGSINNIKKVVYIFMDFHKPSFLQKKCDDIRAVDVNTFFVEEFSKITKQIDFLFEIGPFDKYYNKDKGNYIQEVADLFAKSLELDIESNKVQISKLFPNVRFHYTDIRDILERKIFNAYYDNIDLIANTIYSTRSFNLLSLTKLFENVEIIQSELSMLYMLIYKIPHFNPKIKTSLYSANINTMKTISEKDNYKFIKKIIYKLMKDYKHESVKNTIIQIINTELQDMFMDAFDFIDNMLLFIAEEIDFLSEIKNGVHNILFQQENFTYDYGLNNTIKVLKLYNLENKLYNQFIDIGVYLMDLYKLRRILDKDYVTNAVSYAGAKHSNNYIRLLVKYWDFDITNYSYIQNSNMTQVKKYIKNSKTIDDLNIIFYPTIFKQCSDISSFPKSFG